MAKPKAATPPATKPKFCTANIREIAEIRVCNFKLRPHWSGVGDECPNRSNHLYPLLTGFCYSDWHEGMKIDAPTCKFYRNCPCDCHARLNRMFELSGQERILVNNSTWRANNPYVLPSAADVITSAPLGRQGAVAAVVLESPAPGLVPATVQRTFTPTPSGRAGRGELELWVQEITDIWAVDQEGICSPRYVSECIARRKGIAPPSVGAIDAVFNRWRELGFAQIQRKPTRFEGYTEDGIRLGLDAMKARAKRTAAR